MISGLDNKDNLTEQLPAAFGAVIVLGHEGAVYACLEMPANGIRNTVVRIGRPRGLESLPYGMVTIPFAPIYFRKDEGVKEKLGAM